MDYLVYRNRRSANVDTLKLKDDDIQKTFPEIWTYLKDEGVTDLDYNCGNVWVSTPTFQLKTYLINGISNYTDQQIRVAFTNWNKDGNGNVLAGLTRRRNAEADLFLSGNTGSSCNCSESYSGNYTVTTSSIPLNMRSGHGSSYSVITSIPKGATVYVSKANGSWAHVEYNGYSGYNGCDGYIGYNG